MICPKCGVESDGNFCPNCGAQIVSSNQIPNRETEILIDKILADKKKKKNKSINCIYCHYFSSHYCNRLQHG